MAILVGLVCCLLCSCSSPSSPAPSPVESAASSRSRTAQSSLDAMATALRLRSRPSFDRTISARDPAFATSADRIYRNLTSLPLVSLTLRLGTRRSEPPASKRAVLGPNAFVQQVAVTWRLAGDVGPAEHVLWVTFAPDGPTTTIAGTGDGPADRNAQPIWLLEATDVVEVGSTTVLTGPGRESGRWAKAGSSAAAAVRRRLHSGLGARWNGRLVVEMPSTRRMFDQVLGVTPGSYAQIAAVAWPEGPEPATAALRIVVNPDLSARLNEQGLDVLLTHEATHVATRSAASPAPTWLVEGFADYVAYDAFPGTARLASAALLARITSHGAPSRLPSDADFSPGAADLASSYAQSWLACRYLASRFSAAALGRFYLQVDSGRSVAEALQSVFGINERAFTASWASSLRSAARSGETGKR